MNRPFWSRRRPEPSDFNQDTCESIEPLLSLYADGMAAPEESRHVETHLPTCADCREALAWMQATHRALASRPIMVPPANLQARIAEAIAASSAAPIRLTPIRTFTLRPAYAAAASLIVLAAVLTAFFAHQPSPHLTAIRPMPPTVFAIEPTKTVRLPVKPQHNVIARKSAPSHATVHHDNLLAASIVPPSKTHAFLHKLVQDNQVALVVKTPTTHPLTKLVTQTTHSKTILATNRAVPTEHKLPPIVPKTPAPVVIANSLPKSLPAVAVTIQTPTVTNQSEAAHMQLASDTILGNIHATVDHMSHAPFATIMKSANHTALNVREISISDAAVAKIAYGDLH